MNKKLKLLDVSLCRTPAFSMQDDLGKRWEELKEMISESSPAFYGVIADVNAEGLKSADPKIRFSVWKYFNRARFRATPYGSFAAFSLVPVSSNGNTPLVLDPGMLSHRFTDWTKKDGLTDDYTLLAESSAFFQTNSTLYELGKDYRYIRQKNGVFEIASFTGFPELDTLLKLCRKKTAKETIRREMNTAFQLKAKEVDKLLSQMLSLQLLLTERHPNITGPDYFKRLNNENTNPAGHYIISERKLVTGGFDAKLLRQIPELISFLAGRLPDASNPALVKFRNAFLKKFEQRAVPLMIAIDPETGVSYDNLGVPQTDHELAAIFNISGQKGQEELQIPYTELHRFLLNRLMQGGTIRLEEFEANDPDPTLPLPNTISVLFHLFKGHPAIENAGGCTANALLGRFTIASNELEHISREIVSIEENANPDILFFDIAYQAEQDVDNVNRRKQLYRYELPILTWSCDASPLTFEDILVAVRGREIILWSKKHRKRMIPRIPSAYNYSRSDLAVFRFLCDLQHQQIKSDLNFKLQHFFPHLAFYPRVTFKEIIVSPAMWLLPRDISRAIETGSAQEAKMRLLNWLRRESINFPFKAGHADQTLCFHPDIPADIDAFLLYCNQNSHKEIYISEALISPGDGLHDTDGRKYAAQFVANYSHHHVVYQPAQTEDPDSNNQQCEDSIIFPGAEWLYFEIYCHPARSNSLLLNQISIFLKEIKSEIKKWFFIRYDDPAPHIRLRLHIKEHAEGYRIISRLRSLLEPDCKGGLISDIQVKTYFRETGRYGAGRMKQIEALFHCDSKYVLRLLARADNINQFYALALLIMQQLGAFIFDNMDEQVTFAKTMAGNFTREYGISPVSFKRLNKRFLELNSILNPVVNSSYCSLPAYYKKAFLNAFSNLKCREERVKLLTDVIHMHINRLFISDQRRHDAVLYHYLAKVMMTRRARLTVLSEC